MRPVSRNVDPKLRELERLAATGDQEAVVALLRERIRAGEISRDDVITQARAGDETALSALGVEPGDLEILAIMGRRKRVRNMDEGEQVIRARYRARGWTEDQWGGLRSSGGNLRIKFKPKVFVLMKGKPGEWFKIESHSYKKKAESLVAAARQRLEGGRAVEQIKEVRRKERKKKRTKRQKRQRSELAMRAALNRISAGLTPEERREALFGSDELASAALGLGLEIEHELPDDATEESVDVGVLLSVHAPPIFLSNQYRSSSKPQWPKENTWTDRESGLPIRMWRHSGRQVGIQLGNIPIDPFSGAIDPHMMAMGIGERGRGIAGSIVLTGRGTIGAEAFTFMGEGALFRPWCQLLRGYGLKGFVARADAEGLAMFEDLDRRGELRIAARRGSVLSLICERALEDPRQTYFFNTPRPRQNPYWLY